MTGKIKGIVFDHDGTLINTEQLHYECWRELLLDYSVDFTLDEYIDEHNGVSTTRNAEILIHTYGLDISVAKLCETKQQLTHQRFAAAPSPLMPFAEQTVARCHRDGYALAIATGAGQKEIRMTMNAYPLRRYFNAIATCDQVARGKPAPDVYLLACELLGLAPEACIAVEDTQAGISAAKSAGITCFAVRSVFTSDEGLSRADRVCRDLDEVYRLINGLR